MAYRRPVRQKCEGPFKIATIDGLLVFDLQVEAWQIVHHGSFCGHVQNRMHTDRVNPVVEVA